MQQVVAVEAVEAVAVAVERKARQPKASPELIQVKAEERLTHNKAVLTRLIRTNRKCRNTRKNIISPKKWLTKAIMWNILTTSIFRTVLMMQRWME